MPDTAVLEKKDIKLTKTNKQYALLVLNGERYSCWNLPAVSKLAPGDTVRFEWEQSGDFKNIKEISKAKSADAEEADQRFRVKDLRIAKQVALKGAVELVARMVEVVPGAKEKGTLWGTRLLIAEGTVEMAQIMYKWLESEDGMIDEQEPEPPTSDEPSGPE